MVQRRGSTIAHDPTAATPFHRPDDRFLPLRVEDLVAAISADERRFGPGAAATPAVARAMREVIEQESAGFAQALEERYASFNPDRDTILLNSVAAARTPAGYGDLLGRLRYLLTKANFEELDDVQIDAVVRIACSHGLRIRLNPERVEALMVWVRGRGELMRRHRTWRSPIRGRPQLTEVYRRLVFIARLRDDPHVLIKMFKEIPVEDVEALLPHAEVETTWWDHLTALGGGTGPMWTTTTKLLGAGALVALGQAIWVVLLGLGMVAWRLVVGYRRVRQERSAQRTRNLYFQNLTNNAGAIGTLASMISQEELKEALVLYATCAGLAEPPDSEQAVARRIATFLRERFNVRATFDLLDAVRTLRRLGLWLDEERFRVAPCEAAVQRLHEHWLARRTLNVHEQFCAAQGAEQFA